MGGPQLQPMPRTLSVTVSGRVQEWMVDGRGCSLDDPSEHRQRAVRLFGELLPSRSRMVVELDAVVRLLAKCEFERSDDGVDDECRLSDVERDGGFQRLPTLGEVGQVREVERDWQQGVSEVGDERVWVEPWMTQQELDGQRDEVQVGEQGIVEVWPTEDQIVLHLCPLRLLPFSS